MKLSRGVGSKRHHTYSLVAMALVMLCATLVYLVNNQASAASTQRTYSLTKDGHQSGRNRINSQSPSFVTSLLSSELYLKAQKNPKSLTKEELQSFEAAPWLLPPGTDAFPWHGVTDIDKLVSLRSKPHGKYQKTIALLVFTNGYALMTMNAIYTMVKFGKVDNYVLATLDDGNLEACQKLNLPCMRAQHLVPFDIEGAGSATEKASIFGSRGYSSITWSKPYIVKYLVDQNYAVLFSDGDVAFAPHLVWESYLRYIEDGHTDAAFMRERPINAGTYVVLPTEGGKRFMQLWTDVGINTKWEGNDQTGLEEPYHMNFTLCTTLMDCITTESRVPMLPHVRLYHPAGFPIDTYPIEEDHCSFKNETSAKLFDPCYWTVMYVHSVCNAFYEKKPALDSVDFWFLDYRCDDKGYMPDGRPCLPAIFSELEIEDQFNRCRDYPLALTYEPPEELNEAKQLNQRLKAARVNMTNVN